MLIKDKCAVSKIATVSSDRARIDKPLGKTKIDDSRASGLCDVTMHIKHTCTIIKSFDNVHASTLTPVMAYCWNGSFKYSCSWHQFWFQSFFFIPPMWGNRHQEDSYVSRASLESRLQTHNPWENHFPLSAQLENNNSCAEQQKPSVLNFLPTRNRTNVCIKDTKSICFSFVFKSGTNELLQRIYEWAQKSCVPRTENIISREQ